MAAPAPVSSVRWKGVNLRSGRGSTQCGVRWNTRSCATSGAMAGMTWAALAPLHYVALIRWREEHVWDGVSAWRWAVYGPVLAALLVDWLRRGLVGRPRS